MYRGGNALLEALAESGVRYIFANFGSDHPALIEASAEAKATGRKLPEVLTCPNEMVALSCAHGFAQVSGRAQAVIVHVDCGTQALAGAVHNAAKGRIPVLIFAGLSPFSQEGELRGSRNEFIQWIQDVPDQAGIVRQYMKYENELRTAKNVKQSVRRAMQITESDPKGPVYLTAAREVLEEELEVDETTKPEWPALGAISLAESAIEMIVGGLARAKRPLVVTSYVGRNVRAVAELTKFCRTLGIGVLESVPSAMNFSCDDELYLGNHWNHPFQNQDLADADAILVIDSDVPWIPTVNRPSESATIYHIDVDPLKERTPLWSINARGVFRADAESALRQMNAWVERNGPDTRMAEARRAHYRDRHSGRAKRLEEEARGESDAISPEFLTAEVRKQIGDDAIVLNEGITNYPAICDHSGRTKPGTIFASGGGALGWNGGAAIGARLAAPEKTVVALTGDGSYMFSIPASVHWMARRYGTPFLQVIYNNGGWKAPKFSALAIHPDGHASRAKDIGVSFDPAPDYAGIAAAAGGALGISVSKPDEVENAIAAGLKAVREEKRCAVLDVRLKHL
jgi:acetolactate synthase-1/2/3 large subunit